MRGAVRARDRETRNPSARGKRACIPPSLANLLLVADAPDHAVTLVVPAAPDYLRLARLASADAGSRAGFDFEEIDDLRIAVTELCHLLIGDGTDGELRLQFTAEDGTVTVAGYSARPGAPSDNAFSETILSQVVDEHAVRDDDDGRHFHLLKKRRS